MTRNPLKNRDTKSEIVRLWKENDLVEYFMRIRQWESGNILGVEFYKDLQDVHAEKHVSNKRSLRNLEELRTKFLSSDGREVSHYIPWMAACRDVYDDMTNLFFASTDRDRENEMQRILYFESKLRAFWRLSPGRMFLPGIIRFHLRMYNLPAAYGIAFKTIGLAIADAMVKISARFKKGTAENEKLETVNKSQSNTSIRFGGVGFLVFLSVALIFLWHLLRLPNPFENVETIAKFWPVFGSPPWDLLRTLLAASYLVPLFGIVLLISVKSFGLLFRCFMPRLMAAIVAGYLFLIFPRDVWQLAASISPTPNAIIIAILALAAAWLLLANEVRNRIQSSVLVLTRSLSVLLFGLTQSTLIGIVLSDLFGKEAGGQFFGPLVGIFGEVYTGYILFAAPLALFIGVFAQIIWDDKAVSEPF